LSDASLPKVLLACTTKLHFTFTAQNTISHLVCVSSSSCNCMSLNGWHEEPKHTWSASIVMWNVQTTKAASKQLMHSGCSAPPKWHSEEWKSTPATRSDKLLLSSQCGHPDVREVTA